ncbi:MAG: hypothetical protein U5R31_14255 [Acidimicrobiia bacterium]|nr:hypothetical protein [Acidimicrobiia bacterium]
MLKGFSFCTLERIGGTPCVLIGLGSVKRTSKRDSVLRALMTDQYRRALLAFPDEDVLVGTRFTTPGGFEAFKALDDMSPSRPQGVGRGAGVGAASGEAVRHRERRLRRPQLRGRRRRHLPVLARPRDPEAREDLAGGRGLLRRCRRRPGRLAHRLRLGDGRGPRQARLTPRFVGHVVAGSIER